jgi:hypothetical protein
MRTIIEGDHFALRCISRCNCVGPAIVPSSAPPIPNVAVRFLCGKHCDHIPGVLLLKVRGTLFRYLDGDDVALWVDRIGGFQNWEQALSREKIRAGRRETKPARLLQR